MILYVDEDKFPFDTIPPTPDALPGAPDYGLSQEQVQSNELIGRGLGLGFDEQVCAFFESMKMSPLEIELRMGRPAEFVFQCRQRLEYREMVRRCVEYHSRRAVFSGKSIEDVWNEQILPSAAVIAELRDDPGQKGAVRLKAAQDFLDRASKAPKTTTQVNEKSVKIVIPVSEALEMRRALEDSGEPEDVALIEMMEVDGGFVASGEEEGEEIMVTRIG